jgi:hypothetical protein
MSFKQNKAKYKFWRHLERKEVKIVSFKLKDAKILYLHRLNLTKIKYRIFLRQLQKRKAKVRL